MKIFSVAPTKPFKGFSTSMFSRGSHHTLLEFCPLYFILVLFSPLFQPTHGFIRIFRIKSFIFKHAFSSLSRNLEMLCFYLSQIWVLIATDLMGRGIDFKGVNLVVNYDFPSSAVSYIHRIGTFLYIEIRLSMWIHHQTIQKALSCLTHHTSMQRM